MVQFKSGRKFNKIPSHLIYEMDEGKPIYYQGYRDALNKTKTAEQIMGSSALQSLLVLLIQKFLIKNLGENYLPMASELGFKFAKKSWRNLDIALYDKRKVNDLSIFLSTKYIEVAPEIVIEIDTKAALADLPEPDSYFQKKTDQLLANGVKKVIWVFTNKKNYIIAESGKKQIMENWDIDFEILNNLFINIETLLEEF